MHPWRPTEERVNWGAMERLFADFMARNTGRGESGTNLPIDVAETDAGWEVTAPLPGFKPEQVEITFSGGLLNIYARRDEQEEVAPKDRKHYLRREIFHGSYYAQVPLPPGVDPDRMKARFEDGVLRIEAPKGTAAEAKRIRVESA